jgi:hypothetical protein
MGVAGYGKIAGGVGLLVLLSAPYTFFITSGSAPMALGKVGAGLVLLGAYLGTHWKSLGQFASRKSTYYLLFTAATGVFLLGALGAVNYVAWKKNTRWDLTTKKIHSLAPQTLTTLAGLDGPVRALVFVAAEQPEYELLDQQLARYQRFAKDRFSYAFRDPKRYPDLNARYKIREGRPAIVLLRGEGEAESHVVVHRFTEQDLTNGLLRLQSSGDLKVYFTAGHDEWPLDPAVGQPGGSLSQLVASLQREGYASETLNLAGGQEVPADAAVVVVAGARTRLSPPEEAALEKYLEQGGRLMVFADAMIEGGLDRLLGLYGVQVDNGVLADARYAIQSPYNLVTTFYGEHPISERHQRAQLQTQFLIARGLTVLREGTLEGVTARPVVLTSPYAWLETRPGANPRLDDGEKSGQIPLVVASERAVPAADTRRFEEARVVVFGDSELLLDVNWGVEPNRNLVLNAFGWVTQQANRVTIRPLDRDVSTLDLDQALLTRIHFTATDLLPLLLLGIGVAIWQARRSK